MKEVGPALDWLKQHGSASVLREMGPRYGVHTDKAFGVPMAQMQVLAKKLGRDHALAAALWDTGWYEARMVACMVDEPDKVTAAQMEAWCRDFDNWGITDTACFKLFDQVPHAWSKAPQWARKKDEWVRRAGYVLFACLAAHDRTATEAQFRKALALIEKGADDERNFVKKGVSWALRAIGSRGPTLNAEALKVARRLVESESQAARWVGRAAVKDLTSAATKKRISR